jgi:hypothetical protein
MEGLSQSKDSVDSKKIIIYDLIIQQIKNLVSDLRIVFPKDIVLKVCQDNLNCLENNKTDFLNFLKTSITPELKNLIIHKNESLFAENNKELKNIKFKRSTYVFNKIRNNWSKLDNSNKIVVWKYLNFILKLMDKI